MTVVRREESGAGWRELLELGQRFLDDLPLSKQHDLIQTTFGNIFKANVEICLSGTVFHLPGSDVLPCISAEEAEGNLRKAFDTGIFQEVTTSVTGDNTPPLEVVQIATPFQVGADRLGAIQLQRPVSQPFSRSEKNYFKQATHYIAGLIHLLHQIRIKNWRFEQLSLIHSVSSQLVHVTSIEELAQRVTDLILSTFHYYYVAIFTFSPGHETLLFRSCACEKETTGGAPPIGGPIKVRRGEGIIGSVAETGEEILAPFVENEPRYRLIDSLPETQSEFALPLKIEDQVLGVLDVQSNEPDSFHEIDQLVLHVLANNIAVAIESTRLYEGMKKRADQMSVVADVSRAIASILDVDEILKEVVTLLHERFNYPYVHVFTVHPGRRKIFYEAGSGHRSRALADHDLTYELEATTGIIPWVARSGKTLVANDVSKEPLYRPTELPPLDTKAEIAVPFVYNDEILGLLDVQSDRTDVFDDEDISLFETLAANVAVAMRNARLYRSEKWRRQVAESLRDVAGMLSANPDLDDVLHAILVELQRNLACEVAAIWLIGEDLPNLQPEDGQNLHLASILGGDERIVDQVRSIRADTDEWLNRTLASDEALVRSPGDPAGPLGRALEYDLNYSSLGVPLRAGDQALGVLALAHPAPGRYGSDAQQMAAAFASYAAVAIENTRLYASAQEQAWVSTVLLQVAEATQSMTSVDELLSTVTRLTPMLVGVRGCAVFLWGEKTNRYELAAAYGLSNDQEADFRLRQIIPGAAPAFDRVRESHAPAFVTDCRQDLGLLPTTDCIPDQYAFVLVPLESRGDFLGIFLIEQVNDPGKSEDDRPISREHLSILRGLAYQTAVAIENIRLLEGKQEEAYVTAVLLQVAQAVVGSNNLEDVLSSIVHLIPILVGIDCSLLYLWDKNRKLFYLAEANYGHWKVAKRFSTQTFSLGEYPLLDAVMAKDSMVVCSLENSSIAPDQWMNLVPPETDTESAIFLEKDPDLLIGTPLTVKGDLYGVLLTQESGVDPSFRARRLEIINGVAQQTALAIQNDRLNQEMVERERLEREFQLARDIQRTFLPSKIPEPAGWELDVSWQPAREVGGDFYDAFLLPHRRLGIVIADVSDKGMPAALYMTVSRTLIRAAAQEETSPAKALARVNNLLLMDSQYGMFITCVYAVVSLNTGEVIYANSGHNIPLILRERMKSIQRLEKGGMAMAVLENEHTEDHSITLEPGDSLLMYTDGVTEAFSPTDELFGEARLMKTLQDYTGEPAKGIILAINHALASFTQGAQPSDDITLLALKRKYPKT